MRVVLEFDDVPASQNRQLRMHWRTRRQANETLGLYLLSAASDWAEENGVTAPLFRKSGTAPPARIHVTMWRSKLQDPDNAVACLKGLIDKMVRMGALHDDTREWMERLDVEERVGPKKTRIQIDYQHGEEQVRRGEL